MTATTIDGKRIAAEVRSEVALAAAAFADRHGRPPGLATILVGDDAASAVYVGGKQRACAEVGIRGFDHRLPADATREALLALVDELNADPDVSGVLCQLPLPAHLDGVEVTNRIDAAKDVDGLTFASAGRLASGVPGLVSCTPAGVLRMLDDTGVALAGAEAVVIGRSNLFGKPMAQLLLARDATVTTAHSRTRDLAAVARRADVLVVAVGRPEMVRADWVKPGAVVVDVGINRVQDATRESGTRLVGDVAFDEVAAVASALTPVPGGVGPMTIAQLLANTVDAAVAHAEGAG